MTDHVARLKAVGFIELNRSWHVRMSRPGVMGSVYVEQRKGCRAISCSGWKTYCEILKDVPGLIPGTLNGEYPTWKGFYADAAIAKLEEHYGDVER